MKILNIAIIDGYEIVTGVSLPAVDPEATRNKVSFILSENPDLKNIKTAEALYAENVVFALCGPAQRAVEDQEGDVFQAALENLGGHEKLLSSGEPVDDWRNAEYWVKNQAWEKQKIEQLGEKVPANGVLPENLTAPQQREIHEEQDLKRIAGLTLDERAAEKQERLNAAKREATLLKSDAEIAGEEFDASAWFQAGKAEIEAKYGNPVGV
jgi:hypothetical protein